MVVKRGKYDERQQAAGEQETAARVEEGQVTSGRVSTLTTVRLALLFACVLELHDELGLEPAPPGRERSEVGSNQRWVRACENVMHLQGAIDRYPRAQSHNCARRRTRLAPLQ